jgi:FAD/FMN-containing dehydrogenase
MTPPKSLVWALMLSLCWNLVVAVLPPTDQVRSELGPKLSPNASIYGPTSPEFGISAARWQLFSSPNMSIVVDVHTEDDVVATILYANNHSIPFLATTGGHGTFGSLGGLQHGLQIRLRPMNSITISADGNYATMQGGVTSLEVIQALDAASKQTVTGACECTGLMGAALGGGHGFHQGHYGLIADNIVDARVVLAHGEVVNVSASNNADLFWGLKGAGHNFGVVTEFRYKIYPRAPADLWYTDTLVFSTDKLDAVFTQVNKMMAGTPPVELSFYSTFMHVADVDPVNVSPFTSSL